MLEHPVALDGDETGAGIRRADTHRDGIAPGIRRLIELDLQFGVAFERARELASPATL